MSNLDFLLTYATAPLGFLIAGAVVYVMARRVQHRAHGRAHHIPAE